MACDFCGKRRDEDGNILDLRGEKFFDETMTLDHMSQAQIALCRDEDGWAISLLVDNTHNGVRTVNKLPSTTLLPIQFCPCRGRKLD